MNARLGAAIYVFGPAAFVLSLCAIPVYLVYTIPNKWHGELICKTGEQVTFRVKTDPHAAGFDSRGSTYLWGGKTYTPRGGEVCDSWYVRYERGEQ